MSTKWCTYSIIWLLHGWCHLKLLPSSTLVHVLCTQYNHVFACTLIQYHFMQSHILTVHECLIVTCHLHFWQHDQSLLAFTCYCGNTWVKPDIWISQHRNLTMEKKILPVPQLPPDSQTYDLSIMSLVLNHYQCTTKLSPLPMELCGDKECPFSDITNYGRVWRMGARQQGLECLYTYEYVHVCFNGCVSQSVIIKQVYSMDSNGCNPLKLHCDPWRFQEPSLHPNLIP